jgi:hypothetical protein
MAPLSEIFMWFRGPQALDDSYVITSGRVAVGDPVELIPRS